jgi:hypothetical protein
MRRDGIERSRPAPSRIRFLTGIHIPRWAMPRFVGVSSSRLLMLLLLCLVVSAQLTTAQPTASPAQLTFGAAYVGIASPAQTVTLTNMTSRPLYIGGLFTSGGAAGDFTIVSTICPPPSGTNPATLVPGATCAASIQFTPTLVGADTGFVTLRYSTTLNGPCPGWIPPSPYRSPAPVCSR